MFVRSLITGLCAIVGLSVTLPACAQDSSFDAYLQHVAARARAEGVSERTIGDVLLTLTPNQRVIALDRDNISSGAKPGTFPPLAP